MSDFKVGKGGRQFMQAETGRNQRVKYHNGGMASIEYVLVLFSMAMIGSALLDTVNHDLEHKYERVVQAFEQILSDSGIGGTSGM